jgi:hypothetical protein
MKRINNDDIFLLSMKEIGQIKTNMLKKELEELKNKIKQKEIELEFYGETLPRIHKRAEDIMNKKNPNQSELLDRNLYNPALCAVGKYELCKFFEDPIVKNELDDKIILDIGSGNKEAGKFLKIAGVLEDNYRTIDPFKGNFSRFLCNENQHADYPTIEDYMKAECINGIRKDGKKHGGFICYSDPSNDTNSQEPWDIKSIKDANMENVLVITCPIGTSGSLKFNIWITRVIEEKELNWKCVKLIESAFVPQNDPKYGATLVVVALLVKVNNT